MYTAPIILNGSGKLPELPLSTMAAGFIFELLHVLPGCVLKATRKNTIRTAFRQTRVLCEASYRQGAVASSVATGAVILKGEIITGVQHVAISSWGLRADSFGNASGYNTDGNLMSCPRNILLSTISPATRHSL